MPESYYFKLGQDELNNMSEDHSVPTKAKVAMILFNRQIDMLHQTFKFAGVGAVIVWLSPLLPWDIASILVSSVTGFAFTYWYQGAKRKMNLENREVIQGLGRLTQNERIRSLYRNLGDSND